jgi:hypothetical protein
MIRSIFIDLFCPQPGRVRQPALRDVLACGLVVGFKSPDRRLVLFFDLFQVVCTHDHVIVVMHCLLI